jgi:hypothetical protein
MTMIFLSKLLLTQTIPLLVFKKLTFYHLRFIFTPILLLFIEY